MSLITARPATATPLRGAWVLLLIGLLVAALVASLVIVGSRAPARRETRWAERRSPRAHARARPTRGTRRRSPGLSQPSGLDVGPDGNLYVVNAGKDEILVSPRRRRPSALGRTGRRRRPVLLPAGLRRPVSTIGGVAVRPTRLVYVADTVNDRVQRFDGAGHVHPLQWGGFGPTDGQFLSPFDVASARTGPSSSSTLSGTISSVSPRRAPSADDRRARHRRRAAQRHGRSRRRSGWRSTTPTSGTTASRPSGRTARSAGRSAAAQAMR